MKSDFGCKILIERRRSLGLKIKDVAFQANMRSDAYSKIEGGLHKVPEGHKLASIAKALKMDEEMTANLFAYFKVLPPEIKDILFSDFYHWSKEIKKRGKTIKAI